MEGTSGAEDRVSLRGDVREAALYVGSRVSEVQRGEPADVALLKEGSFTSGGDSSLRRKQVCDRRCPSRSGWGEAPSASDRSAERSNVGTPRRPLICESSAGGGSDKGLQSPATV